MCIKNQLLYHKCVLKPTISIPYMCINPPPLYLLPTDLQGRQEAIHAVRIRAGGRAILRYVWEYLSV
jgi:hypothetical protein